MSLSPSDKTSKSSPIAHTISLTSATEEPAEPDYPEQDIHPDIVNALYALAPALYREWRATSLIDGFDSRMIAQTLRLLDRKGHCLWPTRPQALRKTIADAKNSLRYVWKRNALGEAKRSASRPVLFSLDDRPADSETAETRLERLAASDPSPERRALDAVDTHSTLFLILREKGFTDEEIRALALVGEEDIPIKEACERYDVPYERLKKRLQRFRTSNPTEKALDPSRF